MDDISFFLFLTAFPVHKQIFLRYTISHGNKYVRLQHTDIIVIFANRKY